jgi:biotin carboxylase
MPGSTGSLAVFITEPLPLSPSSLSLSDHLARLKVTLAQETVFDSVEQAMTGAKSAGYPLCVRSTGEDDPRFCAVLRKPDDLRLACQQAGRRGDGGVILQTLYPGRVFRIWCAPRVTPVEALCLGAIPLMAPPYWIPGALVTLPCPANLAEAVALLGESMRWTGWMEAEFRLSDEASVMTGLWRCDSPPPVVATLWQRRHGGAAAACWLQARSGRVTGISGVEETLQGEGVLAVEVAAQPGDTLTHVIDERSRDTLGYVVAEAADAEAALAAAQSAASRVQIHTTAMLD